MNRPAFPLRRRRPIAVVLTALVAACSSAPPPAAPPLQAPAPVEAPPPPPPPSPFDGSNLNLSIRTENALFRSAKFTDLPGWRQDDLRTAWPAFVRSCRVLVARDGWRDLCQRAAAMPAADNAQLRTFFEREFVPLSITNLDTTPEGDVTGYYEPLIAGSLVRTDGYTVPVLSRPSDLYVFDWRKLPAAQRRGTIRARPVGGDLVLAKPGEVGSLALDWALFSADTRERKLRTRIDGDRVVPYWTRQDIVERQLAQASVIAWVQDPLALYAMQVQGAGRIQLPDQRIIRLAFAEQNGQPFKPLRLASKPAPAPGPRTRSLRDLGAGADAPEQFQLLEPEPTPASSAGAPVRTRGARASTSVQAPDVAPAAPRSGAALTEADVIAALAPRSPGRSKSAAAATTASGPAAISSAPATPGAAPGSGASSAILARLSSDPSYVFFRVAGDIPAADGPIGALGVSLTPERSVAVDPRATPIGYPLYIAAKPSRGAAMPIERLVVAQDTGGAIRGAVRADYFWGYGRDAGRRASGTELRGRMWVMIPRVELPTLVASSTQAQAPGPAPRTRGARAVAIATPSKTCLVADDDFCSDD